MNKFRRLIPNLHFNFLFKLLCFSRLEIIVPSTLIDLMKCRSHRETRLITGRVNMMVSSNGNIFLGYWPFVREFTSHQWISLTKANDVMWRFDVSSGHVCVSNEFELEFGRQFDVTSTNMANVIPDQDGRVNIHRSQLTRQTPSRPWAWKTRRRPSDARSQAQICR